MLEKQCHILLAEDNPADVFLIKEALRQNSIVCVLSTVDNGEKAARFVRRQGEFTEAPRPNLIVLDLNLPRVDGSEILQIVRGTPELSEIPVLILSSSDAPYDRERTSKLGASGYIRKPSDLDQFMSIGREFKRLLGMGEA